MHLNDFPRRRYMQGVTPIEKLERLSRYLDGPEIYIKRDDLTGLPFGGNKTRKLEFLMADALAKGADTIVTCGAVQSNHCRLTLAAANREGLGCHLVLEERVPKSYDPYANGNNLLFHLLHPEKIHLAPYGKNPSDVMEEVSRSLCLEGKKPYIIPVGGSNAIGDLGYVACADEILGQMAQMQVRFDRIFITSGSAGSHAGLLAGMKMRRQSIEIYGIGINRPQDIQAQAVLELANDTLMKLGETPSITMKDVVVNCAYVGGGYSVPTEAMKRAVKLMAEKEAILLDPTYTGKTMSGLMDLIEKKVVKKQETILFIHTGGTPGLFAHPALFFEEAIPLEE